MKHLNIVETTQPSITNIIEPTTEPFPLSKSDRIRRQYIEPCRTAAMGTLPSLPIPIDTLSISAFLTFIQLLYQPSSFKTNIIGWNRIKDLAMTWGLVDITLLAMVEIQELESERRSTIR